MSAEISKESIKPKIRNTSGPEEQSLRGNVRHVSLILNEEREAQASQRNLEAPPGQKLPVSEDASRLGRHQSTVIFRKRPTLRRMQPSKQTRQMSGPHQDRKKNVKIAIFRAEGATEKKYKRTLPPPKETFGKLFWPQQRHPRWIPKPYKTWGTISTTKSFLCGPHFFRQRKFRFFFDNAISKRNIHKCDLHRIRAASISSTERPSSS